jgi:hypothetical protein
LIQKVACDAADDAIDVAWFEASIGNRTKRCLKGDALRVVTLKHPRLLGIEDADNRHVTEWMTHFVPRSPKRRSHNGHGALESFLASHS